MSGGAPSNLELVQHINEFFSNEENYHNAVLDYLEGSTFPQLLESIEQLLVDNYYLNDKQRDQLHELLASDEFETSFKTGWPEDIEGDFEEWEGSVEDFVTEHDLEWQGL